MANHKRRKPKSGRAGCLLCKPHKHQASKDRLKDQTRQERRARLAHEEQVEDLGQAEADSRSTSL